MNFKFYSNDKNFLITNSKKICSTLPEKTEDTNRLYGYYFDDNDLHKDCELTNYTASHLKNNLGTISGLFCSIIYKDKKISLLVDPLVQYSIFYYIGKNEISISNDLLTLSKLHELNEMSDEHLFDSIAYRSPLRGLTIIKDIYTLQYDDLVGDGVTHSHKKIPPLNSHNLSVARPNNEIYNQFEYKDLLKLYIHRLNTRSRILSEKFEEIHIQLTGGADSRLTLSSMLMHDNFYCYCYGNGESSNRLFFEQIVTELNLKISDNIPFVGRSLSNSSLIIKGLIDSNFRKFNNLNTYVNSDDFMSPEKCKVTGYYGANISGGVALPPIDTDKNIRTKFIDKSYYTYHNYINDMKRKHHEYRKAAFNDLFYINNRGPSHYGSHSIADNKKCNSFDILYDPINIHLVRKCPYTDDHINRNAISIDLIYKNHKMLALFPYESRKIPKYREFKNIPLINCFNGFDFPKRTLAPIRYTKVAINTKPYDLLMKGDKHASIDEMLQYEEFNTFYEKYNFLKRVKYEDQTTSSIILFYMLSYFIVNNQSRSHP